MRPSQSLLNLFSISSQSLLNLFSISSQFLLNLLSISSQSLFISSQSLLNLFSISSQSPLDLFSISHTEPTQRQADRTHMHIHKHEHEQSKAQVVRARHGTVVPILDLQQVAHDGPRGTRVAKVARRPLVLPRRPASREWAVNGLRMPC